MAFTLCALMLITCGQVPPPRSGVAVAADLRVELRGLLGSERTNLTRLERATHDAALAAEIRAAVPAPDPPNGPRRFVPFPEFTAGNANPEPRDPAPDRKAFLAIRTATAKALFALAQRSLEAGNETYHVAAQALRGVLQRDPDHREARRLLGFVPYRDGWATPQAAINLKAHKVLHPTFGWVPADWVPHLEAGELPGLNEGDRPVEWLPAGRADELRRGFTNRPWIITTENFEIRANVPLSETIAFGRRLEALREIFNELCADLLEPRDLRLAQLAKAPTRQPTPETRRHQVWYFSSKSEYLSTLMKRFGRSDDISLGFFMPSSEAKRYRDKARSYFYRDPQNALGVNSTLFHEGSHQLLFESGTPSAYGGNDGQFWVWEGLGTYFETLTAKPDGTYTIGGLVGPRIAKARSDAQAPGGPRPCAELIALDQITFNDEEAVYSNYAQAMALVVFLMDFDHGRYREAFLSYARDAYRGRFRRGRTAAVPLLERLGLSPQELDTEFRRFLLTADPPAPPPG